MYFSQILQLSMGENMALTARENMYTLLINTMMQVTEGMDSFS